MGSHADVFNCTDYESWILHQDKIQSDPIQPISFQPFQEIWIARVLVKPNSSVIAPNEGASQLQSRFFKVPYFCATSKTTSLCEGDMVSIPSVSSKLIGTCTCCTSMLVRDDRMSSSSLAQTLLSRLDLTSVSEGDCLLSDQPLDLTSVSEGDHLLSKQASVRNLHESSWFQNAKDIQSKLNLLVEPIIASVSEGDVLSSRVTVSNLSNSGSILINQLDAQDVHISSLASRKHGSMFM
jgi:hypothetical protein